MTYLALDFTGCHLPKRTWVAPWSRLIAWRFRDRVLCFPPLPKQRTIIRVYLAPEERGSANLTWRLWRQARSGTSLVSQVVSHGLGVHSWTSWPSAQLQGKSASPGNVSTPQANLQKPPMHGGMAKIVVQQPWCWGEWWKTGQNLLFWKKCFQEWLSRSKILICLLATPTVCSSLWKLQPTHSTGAGCALDSSTVSSSLHRLSHYLLTATPGAHAVTLYRKPKFKEMNEYQGCTALRAYSQQVLQG